MENSKELLSKVCAAIEEKKGEDVRILDISGISSFTDFFVICHGYNQRQNRAICDEIKERLKKEQRVNPSHIEGYDKAEWILMDYLSCIVHVFSPESREFYKLERLWRDGEEVERDLIV